MPRALRTQFQVDLLVIGEKFRGLRIHDAQSWRCHSTQIAVDRRVVGLQELIVVDATATACAVQVEVAIGAVH